MKSRLPEILAIMLLFLQSLYLFTSSLSLTVCGLTGGNFYTTSHLPPAFLLRQYPCCWANI